MIDLGLFRRPTVVGAMIAMAGYGAGAQVMVFFLPLFLQNAYGFGAMAAGVAMLPFALPMVLTPRLISGAAGRLSGRTLLTAGLAVTVAGNLLFAAVARAGMPYDAFVGAMLVAGSGAGVLNGTTVKALSAAVPAERAGMASGLASTTRFVGILVSVALMGTIVSGVVRLTFGAAAVAAGLTREAALPAAKRVAAGDLAAVVGGAPLTAREMLQAAGRHAFAEGFADASLLAAAFAAGAGIGAYLLVRQDESTLARAHASRPCKLVDCRDPL